MKKRFFCRIVGLLLTLLLLLGILSFLNRLTYRKSFPNCYDEFFPSSDQYDVLFLGNSHIWNGVFPLELWGRCGITSYNLGNAGAQTGSLYWLARCALEHSTPRVIVFDCHNINSDSRVYLPFFHNALAAFPFSLNKIRAAYDLCPPGVFSPDDRLSLIFGFSAYHNRWSELSVDDFSWKEPAFFGARPLIRLDTSAPPFATEAALVPSGPNTVYLRRLAEDCKARNIRLILTTLPFSATEQDAEIANGLQTIAAELGVDYLNLLQMDLVDFQTDFADRDSHCNISGACKLSEFFADYLSKTCNLPDHRGDPDYDYWDSAYASWLETMDSELETQNFLFYSLMLLRHSRYSPIVYISPCSDLFDDPMTLPYLRSMCGEAELPGFDRASSTKGSYLVFFDRSANKAYEAVDISRISGTPYGDICVEPSRGLASIGGRECQLSAVTPDATESEAMCFVFSSDLQPLSACSHAFAPGELNQYYRTDYAD